MVSLEPFELLDHHGAGRERVRVLVWKSGRQENLGKARICSRCLARVLSGGGDEVVNDLSGGLHTLHWDAAAASIAQEEASCLCKLRRIGGIGYPAAQKQQQGSGNDKS